jgi:hypothetical protein
MLTKPLLTIILAACGVSSAPVTTEPDDPDEPGEFQPTGPHEKDGTYFCCLDVDAKTKTGEGCVTIGEKEVDRCATVLACQEFVKKDGKVTCL